MNKVKYYILLCLLPIPIIVLVSCMGGGEGGGLDIVQLVKNPVVQVLIFIVVLWLVFKGSKK